MQDHPPHSTHLELDLSDAWLSDLVELDIRSLETATVYLPLPSVGSTNMHSDICADYLDASWAAEKLAAAADKATVRDDYEIRHKTRLKLELLGIHPEFLGAIEDSIVLFQGGDEREDRYKEIRNTVYEFEENLDTYNPALPEIIDDYFANLVNGAYYEYRSESPDYYESEIAKYPERQLGFHKTALSHRLGASSFVSKDSWLVPASVGVDHFFETTEQKYRLDDFVTGTIFMIGGKSFVRSDELTAYFPMSQYFKSRVCASFALRDDEDTWPWDWNDAVFTHAPFRERLPPHVPDEFRAGRETRERCLVHPTGTLVILDDDRFRHFLYDTAPLNLVAVKQVHEELAELAGSLAPLIGLSPSLSCDWSSLTDEDFEQLCYDLIFAHPKFDSDTIRKLGKSRSRDGGRDIEVHEVAVHPGARPRKWLFQCKLITDRSSLTARKLQDLGDMLEIHGAEGFGVMTSAPIDATLYDKMNAICGKRGLSQLHFSKLEIERALVRYPSVRDRYFREQPIDQ
ncbi:MULTISPECIES: hypothetical protein [unclassified Bradyrhizobium]|uniref:hypothetical protein n=1 Tax=unclassified Bradyrhizobium TaxID=2631580 RepID=UPI002916B8AE|nr:MULTISPECIES: hypothetical protein [unclassified Bradyrhizobium]